LAVADSMSDLEMRGTRVEAGGAGGGDVTGVEKEKARLGDDSWMICVEVRRGEDGREEAK
jgi:hypothetical protein